MFSRLNENVLMNRRMGWPVEGKLLIISLQTLRMKRACVSFEGKLYFYFVFSFFEKIVRLRFNVNSINI